MHFDSETIFSFCRIGFGGVFTEEYESVWEISKTEAAKGRFSNMLTGKTNQEKLYGLVGLKIIQSDEFDKSAKELEKIDGELFYGGGGCMIIPRTVKWAVDQVRQSVMIDPNRQGFQA